MDHQSLGELVDVSSWPQLSLCSVMSVVAAAVAVAGLAAAAVAAVAAAVAVAVAVAVAQKSTTGHA